MLWIVSLTLAFTPSLAAAHAGEQGFVLLLPTGLYSTAGVLTVVLSLLLVSLVRKSQVDLWFTPKSIGLSPAPGWLRGASGLCATFGLFCLIAIGLTGPSNPVANLLPLTIWTVIWVGLIAAQGFLGDVWSWINPWQALYDLINPRGERFARLPEALGIWPAVVMLILVNGFVLADIAPNDPRRLAGFVLGYWLVTFAGMIMFGARDWLTRAECFTVLMTLFASLAALKNSDKVRLGLPGWHSLGMRMNLSQAMFCIALLACGSFDGLNETFWWLAKIGLNPLEYPGRSAAIWTSTIGLWGANVALAVTFCAAVWVGVALAQSQGAKVDLLPAICKLALCLLPIAFGYHVAHYLTSFLVQIQYVALAMNDPMGNGANLLGLAGFQVTTGFLNTPGPVRVIWLSQAGAVVASHVLSVLMAHHVAHQLFETRRAAVLSQVGIGVLMVVYTVFGLWLLASPRGV